MLKKVNLMVLQPMDINMIAYILNELQSNNKQFGTVKVKGSFGPQESRYLPL